MLDILKFFFDDVGHFMMLVFLLCVVSFSIAIIVEASKGDKK